MALSSEYASQRPSQEEVINDPTVPKHYWRFRIHTPLEALLADCDWLATIAGEGRRRGSCKHQTKLNQN